MPIPRGGAQAKDGITTFQVGKVDWMSGLTFQQLHVPQPIKSAVLVIRSLVETSPAAFVGGVEMSLPHFTGHEGVCTVLRDVIGIIEGGRRWSTFLTAASRTSVEFNTSWSSLNREATQYAT